jgi:4-hydroxy-3-polyprenylbenzoate decarboxylase
MNFPEIMDIALPAEGIFHNLAFVSIRKTYPMQAYKIMHGLWGMGQTCLRRGFGRQVMFTKYIVVVDGPWGRPPDVHNTSEVLFRLYASTDATENSEIRTEARPGRRARPRPPANSPCPVR